MTDDRPRCDAFVLIDGEEGEETQAYVCTLVTPHDPWLHINGKLSWSDS